MKKLTICILLIIMLLFSTASVGLATEYIKTTTHYYSCNAHTNCCWIQFKSHGETSTGEVFDKYFSGHYAHWPNNFREDSVWSYTVGTTGYAKGKYTVYTSLITEWISIAFWSSTKTITHTY